MTNDPPLISIYLRYLGGGGADIAFVNLARGFQEQGIPVEFVLSQAGGSHEWKIPSTIRIVDLNASNTFSILKALTQYLQRTKPMVLLTALHFNNEIAVVAKKLARVSTKVVVCEQNTLSQRAKNETRLVKRLTPFFVGISYRLADEIVAVSQGVARDLTQITGIPQKKINVIYNPAITPELKDKAKEPLDHPWFAPGEPPIILGVGKLEPQKDFPTLIHAFSQVRKALNCRLIILGWGPENEKAKLVNLVKELNIEKDVSLPGYVNNPFAYMARASVFALSSRWEGLPFVLVEAMGAGVPVVSTNCESGPSEILNNGEFGALVPVGDSQQLALAILKVLSGEVKQIDQEWLAQFSLRNIVEQYLNLFGISRGTVE